MKKKEKRICRSCKRGLDPIEDFYSKNNPRYPHLRETICKTCANEDRVLRRDAANARNPARATCFVCHLRLSHPHFSREDEPKVFCTFHCANQYHRQHGCGLYKIDRNAVVLIDDGGLAQSRLVMQMNPTTGRERPINHPLDDE